MSEKHTPLPWRVFVNKDGTRLVGVGGPDAVGILDAGFGVWSWDHPEGIANAELVVRSVNAMPELVRALEAARVALADGAFEGPFVAGALSQINAALAKVKT